MTPPPVLRVAPDYGCYPLWERTGDDGLVNVSPRAYGLPQPLAEALMDWADAFDATLNEDDPPASGFVTNGERTAFVRWGRSLAAWVSTIIGSPVHYFDVASGEHHVVE